MSTGVSLKANKKVYISQMFLIKCPRLFFFFLLAYLFVIFYLFARSGIFKIKTTQIFTLCCIFSILKHHKFVFGSSIVRSVNGLFVCLFVVWLIPIQEEWKSPSKKHLQWWMYTGLL